jgi:hypothetical protein
MNNTVTDQVLGNVREGFNERDAARRMVAIKAFHAQEPSSSKGNSSIRSDTRTTVNAAAKPLSDRRWIDATSARGRRENNLERLIARFQMEFDGRVAERIIALFILGIFWALSSSRLCLAQVQLPAVNLGETSFKDGFASPGWILEEFPEGYIAGELRSANGTRIPGQSRLVTYSTTTHVVFVSKKRVLGGWLAAEVLQPLVDLDLRSANGTSSRVSGFGDISVGPALQWAPKKIRNGVFVHRFVPIVTVPTGTYSDQRAANIGNHFVVINPYYAVTYERKRIEFSARAHYLWNSTNNDPYIGLGIKSIQPGQAFHINYASSYEVRKGLRFGFNGYLLQQTTDHRVNNVAIHDSKERTVGLGPGMQLGGAGIWFHLNAYLETDVRNRPSGVKVTMRISKVLPAEEP